jgi:transketolase
LSVLAQNLPPSKLRPFGATFLIFSDCARLAIRLAASMELPTILAFTDDAMGDDAAPESRIT